MSPNEPRVRVFEAHSLLQLKDEMRRIGVDPYGIKLMGPKGLSRIVKISALPTFAANLLKQEMLSLGGDVALMRAALTGGTRLTDCLVIATLTQLSRLREKLRRQPFGLGKLGDAIVRAVGNFDRDRFCVDAAGRRIVLSRPLVMGILNVTPDSFSGDGLWALRRDPAALLERARRMVGDGAAILDIGGESSRPGARAVSLKEEMGRVLPTLRALAKALRVPLSIDTTKPEVAAAALDAGAVIVTDISGLRSRDMRRVVKRFKAAAIVMHMRGNPRTMQANPVYGRVVEDIVCSLQGALCAAADEGIDPGRLFVDPGICFGKTAAHNFQILKNLGELRTLGRPVVVGVSRKSFIGSILGKAPQERLAGSIAAAVLAAAAGAKVLRVHDVKQTSEALRIHSAIEAAQ